MRPIAFPSDLLHHRGQALLLARTGVFSMWGASATPRELIIISFLLSVSPPGWCLFTRMRPPGTFNPRLLHLLEPEVGRREQETHHFQ